MHLVLLGVVVGLDFGPFCSLLLFACTVIFLSLFIYKAMASWSI